jgi:hypothetical protein
LIDSDEDNKLENAYVASEHLFQLRLGAHMGPKLSQLLTAMEQEDAQKKERLELS